MRFWCKSKIIHKFFLKDGIKHLVKCFPKFRLQWCVTWLCLHHHLTVLRAAEHLRTGVEQHLPWVNLQAELGKQKQKDSWPRFARMPLPKGIALIGGMLKPLTQPGTPLLPVATYGPWGSRSNIGYLGKVCVQHETWTDFLINSQKYMQGLN